MQVKTAGSIVYYEFDSFDPAVVAQAVFARHGGQSPAPYASLNMSVSTGDSRENVRANRARAFAALDRQPDSVADRPEVTLFLRFADCVPILLYDPRRPAVGLVHAGWRGTLAKAPAAAVQAMAERYGSRPGDLVAAIGPSIGPCHYAVGPEVVEQTRHAFPGASDDLLERVNGGHHLNLWAANARALRDAGVEQIENSALCTACHGGDFFSHRTHGARTGRFAALLGIR